MEISTGAFQACAALAEVYIPAHGNLTTLADNTFYTCSSLRALSIPHGVTAIPYRFCRDCTSLVNVTIPATVASIGVEAFTSCGALEAVSFADSESSQLQIISTSAFYGCASLRSMTIPALVTDIQSKHPPRRPPPRTRISPYAALERAREQANLARRPPDAKDLTKTYYMIAKTTSARMGARGRRLVG